MNNNKNFPDETILLINFIRPEEFHNLLFNRAMYKVIGNDDVGNFIGIADDNTVHYLETVSNNVFYIAPSAEIFIQQLELYKKYAEEYPLSASPSDEELTEYASGFMQKIRNLDENAFYNENTFWSVIAEQMEAEQL